MKISEIMDTIMKEKQISKAQLGRAVGIEDEKHPSDVINKRLKQKNISVNVLGEMLEVMGYTIIISPIGTKRQNGEYEVDHLA